MPKAHLLREAVERASAVPLRFIGTHNALCARIAEQAGFDGCWISSFEVSAVHGLPDANLVGMREVLGIAQMIDVATSLPVLVDADNGYGSTEAAVRAARE